MRPLRLAPAAALLLLTACAASGGQSQSLPVAAADVPFTVADGVVQSPPDMMREQRSGADVWSAAWKADSQGHMMTLEYTADGRIGLQHSLDQMNARALKNYVAEGAPSSDERQDGHGSTAMWDGNVDWALASVKNWGSVRRWYCVSFNWQGANAAKQAAGTYCRIGSATGDAVAMLREVDFHAK